MTAVGGSGSEEVPTLRSTVESRADSSITASSGSEINGAIPDSSSREGGSGPGGSRDLGSLSSKGGNCSDESTTRGGNVMQYVFSQAPVVNVILHLRSC